MMLTSSPTEAVAVDVAVACSVIEQSNEMDGGARTCAQTPDHQRAFCCTRPPSP
jgi:hypothetical protein